MAKQYRYGAPPLDMGFVLLDDVWHEYMHYLYLPVVMPGQPGIRLPRNLAFLADTVYRVMQCESIITKEPLASKGFGPTHPMHGVEGSQFVYVTARRGFAAPGNPLNRPGWHADGFGSDDINYIWSDRWPTRFATGNFVGISTDHVESAEQFEHQILVAQSHAQTDEGAEIEVYSGEPSTLYRLDPSVVHATPIIDPPGGDRSFFKVSVSPNQYNLKGNSHNHLFDYSWKMWPRDEIRNDPAFAGGDIGPQE